MIKHHKKERFHLRNKSWINSEKKCNLSQQNKGEKHMIILTEAEKTLDKIQYPLLIIPLSKVEIELSEADG